ncbi:MAG: hypothetical protein HW386_897 [Gammaproteobacteria bacterium]|nr:hypothetical protein [Gammaproteobacteria bacterium]
MDENLKGDALDVDAQQLFTQHQMCGTAYR